MTHPRDLSHSSAAAPPFAPGGRPDLDAVLEQGQARDGVESGNGGVSVPFSFEDVAAALEAQRPAFEHGHIFTPRMLDATVAGLRATPSPSGL